MGKLQLILLVAICCIAYGSARPTIEDEHSRRISKHERSSLVRRHADVNVSSVLAKMIRSRKRIELLKRIIDSASGEKGNISVERSLQTSRSKHIERKLEQEGLRSNIGLQVFPRKEVIPDHHETSERLLSHLNGEKSDDNLRVRVVDQRPVTAPRHINEFISMADNLRQQAAMAKTCLELQKTILKIPSIRIKVRCKTEPPRRSHPVVKSLPRAQPLTSYGYRPVRPARRYHLNGYKRPDGLSRRHTYYQRYRG